MRRWSVIKRIGRINFDEFIRFAEEFLDTMSIEIPVVTTTFYRQLPASITKIDFDLQEWLDEENRKKQIAQVTGLGNITREMFDNAANVYLTVRPKRETRHKYLFGSIECKGLKNDRLVFYVQPDEVAEPVQNSFLGRNKLPTFKFKIGDGWEHLHHVSLS